MAGQTEQYANQYFTGTQASIFIGDIWVDECYGVQFHATQSIVPMYGYASRFFDAVAVGKSLVQGVFEINFIDEGYLFAVFEEAQKRFINNAGVEDPERTLADQVADKLKLLQEINVERPGPDAQPAQEIFPNDPRLPLQDPRDFARRDVMSSVLTDLANMSIVEADQLASRLVKDRQPAAPTRSVIYQAVPFNLTGYFGNPARWGKAHGTFKELKNCFLVSNEMIVGSNDEVVRERYSFICQMHV